MPTLATKLDDGLPKREFLLLTQYIAWELDGVARTDDEVTQLRAAQYEDDQKRWWDCLGPGWLRSNLELIRDGKSWPLSTNGNTEIDAHNQGALSRARNWLAKIGLFIDEALAEIDADLARRASEIAAFKQLESFIWSESAAGRATLWARKWNENTRAPEAEYGTIPASFFLRRATFSCGNGYHGKGELARWPEDDSEQGLLDSVFNKNDPPVTYVEVKISRADAFKLHEKYRARYSKPESPEMTERAEQVLQSLQLWTWDEVPASTLQRRNVHLRTALTQVVTRDEPLCAYVQDKSHGSKIAIAFCIEGQILLAGAVIETESQTQRSHAANAAHDGRFKDLAAEFEQSGKSLLDFLNQKVADAWEPLRIAGADGEMTMRGTKVRATYNANECVSEVSEGNDTIAASAFEPLCLHEHEQHGLCLAQGDPPSCGEFIYWKSVTIDTGQLSSMFPFSSPATIRLNATVAAETQCKRWLIETMKGDPSNQHRRKNADLLAVAKKKFAVSNRAFNRAKASAIEETKAVAYGHPGAKKKSPHS